MPRGDVFPRRNLPNEAEQWGRAHDNRIVEAEASLDQIEQSVQGLNRSTASSLTSIARQIEAIQEAQQALADQQAEIVAAQADIVSAQNAITQTTNFLSTQTVYDSKSTLDQYSGSTTSLTWEGFNGTYDCSVSVTTGSAGRLLIQASATLLSGGTTSILGIEVVGQTGPTYPGAYSTYVSALSAASSGVSRSVVFSGSPNTTYTVRLRRGRDGDGPGAAMWRDQTLVVTRY